VVALPETDIWADALEMPAALEATLSASEGFGETADLLKDTSVKRIVASGNGASFYVAHALWLASLAGEHRAAEVIAVPAGMLADGRFHWRPGDRLLVISSSGELRDAVEAVNGRLPLPYVAVTSRSDSTLGTNAASCAIVRVSMQRAVTHTQAYVGNLVTALALWAAVTDDSQLAAAVAASPDVCATSLAAVADWVPVAADAAGDPSAAVVFGSHFDWAAALEAALLLKELAGIPAEGVETREGATSASFGLSEASLAVSLSWDDASKEAETICESMGARLVRAPRVEAPDPRLSPLTSFPPALALAIELSLRRGKDVDRPMWMDAYFATARVMNADADGKSGQGVT
jgi:glucosamine 6-phosphate synthetase-like amidotransferase/phosphosugar isomerase protein